MDTSVKSEAEETLEMENSIESGGGDETDERMYTGFISNDMIEEEKKLTKEMEAEEKRIQEELEKQKEEEEEEQVRQQQFKQLMHLLTRSKFYTDFLYKRLSESRKEVVPCHVETMKGESKPEDDRSLLEKNIQNREEKEDAGSPVRRLKTKRVASGQENKNVKKRKVPKKDVLSTVLDEEMIKTASKLRDKEVASESNVNNEETRITDLGHVVSVRQPVLVEGGTMRDYQLDGLEWLKCLYENGMNGILADEMGLGKTIQVISLICHLIEMKCNGPYLIIAPLSTLPNWIMEFERFAPQIPILLYHGSRRFELIKKMNKLQTVGDAKVYPVVLTSFEIPFRDDYVFLPRKWYYIIVDEGHRLKNYQCLLARTLRKFRSANRLILTGTPLQNNLAELWALLNYLLPDIFNDLALFESWFNVEDLQESDNKKIIEQEQHTKILSTIHEILTPFLLRRLKADVALSIPPKKELLVYAPMTPIQLEFYKRTVEYSIENMFGYNKSLIIEPGPDGQIPKRKCSRGRKYMEEDSDDDFEEETGKKNVIEIVDSEDKDYKLCLTMQSPRIQLKKIVNHPYLIQMPLLPGKVEIKVDEELVKKSGKLLVMDAMLAKLKQGGHKVLVFSTYTMILDLLEEYVLLRNYNYCRLDGKTNIETRRTNIKLFNTDPDVFLFLISTRAGGLGINLTGADTVIIFDSDWNPQVDLQAQDRCHRIGQTKPVVVYRLVTSGTIDERIVERAGAKRKLEKMIIHKDKFKLNKLNSPGLIDLEELDLLLSSKDHQKVIHSNGYVFTDEELDALLDRSDLLGDRLSGNEKKATNKRIFKEVSYSSVEC